MSAVKKGQVSDSRLAILMKTAEETLEKRGPVTVDRSGGGVWVIVVTTKEANGAISKTIMESSTRRDEFSQIKRHTWVYLSGMVPNDWGWGLCLMTTWSVSLSQHLVPLMLRSTSVLYGLLIFQSFTLSLYFLQRCFLNLIYFLPLPTLIVGKTQSSMRCSFFTWQLSNFILRVRY